MATKAAKQARKSSAASIILELTKLYSSDEVSKGVYYLNKVKSENLNEFEKNRYSFARKYLENISPVSKEWKMRRNVSSFYGDVAGLIEAGLIDEEVVFTSVAGPDDIAIVEFLEPIETIIREKYYSLSENKEWVALRLLHRVREWEKRGKTDQRFTLPNKPTLYSKSENSNNTN